MNTKEIGQLEWIEKQQLLHDRDGYSTNKTSIGDELNEQHRRHEEIQQFGSDHALDDRDTRHGFSSLTPEQQAFLKLQVSAGRRLECLKTVSGIDRLEDHFAALTNEFAITATELVDRHCCSEELCHPHPGITSDQGSIQAVRSNWRWMSKLLKCADVHLQNAADYHQFFHEVKQYEQWMASDLHKAGTLMQKKDLQPNSHGDIANELLLEMKTAITLFLQWSKRLDAVFEKSKTLSPIHLRTKKLDYAVPAKALCGYRTKEITLAEGEDVTLLDNGSVLQWQVRTKRADTGDVPSTIVLIPGPDPAAVQAALRLRLQFLSLWTAEVKRIGKAIVCFLLQVIRDWTPEEEKMLRNLSDADKKDVGELLTAIEKTFSLYWRHYPPYNRLQDRSSTLDTLLHDESPESRSELEHGRILVIQTGIVSELLARYREFWHYWDVFKVLTEVTRHPEFLLVVDNWKDYKFTDSSDWLKKWQQENADSEMADGDADNPGSTDGVVDDDRKKLISTFLDTLDSSMKKPGSGDSEMADIDSAKPLKSLDADKKKPENGNSDMVNGDTDKPGNGVSDMLHGRVRKPGNGASEMADFDMENPEFAGLTEEAIMEELKHVMERARETAETSHMTTSEHDEMSSFVITSVLNPRTNEEISFDDAIALGIINQKQGTYVNSRTRESMPIQMAMNAGKIKVEVTTTKKTAERRKDVALITIKTVIESRPFVVRKVIDAKTEKKMDVDEAVRAKILDQKRRIYVNSNTNEELTLVDALDSGLLEVEFEKEAAAGNGEAEAVTKTYAVHAVVDVKNKKRLTFREAIDLNIFDPDAGSYLNTATEEKLYVGDAIRKGFIKATVVHDMNAIDPKLLSVANRVTIADEAMSKFRDKRREAGKN